MRLNYSTFRNHVGSLAMLCTALTLLTSNALFAQEPPRLLPLPIEVRPIQPEPEEVFFGESVEPLSNAGQPAANVVAVSHNAPYVTPPTDTLTPPSDQEIDSSGFPVGQSAQSMRIGGYRHPARSTSGESYGNESGSSSTTGLSKVVASLAVVLGLLFGFVWIARRFGSVRSQKLPAEVIQVLGQFSLGGRQQACVVRFGSKLLALSVTPTGVESLGELDDVEEVEGLTQLCLASNPAAVPERLRKAVDRYAAARAD